MKNVCGILIVAMALLLLLLSSREESSAEEWSLPQGSNAVVHSEESIKGRVVSIDTEKGKLLIEVLGSKEQKVISITSEQIKKIETGDRIKIYLVNGKVVKIAHAKVKIHPKSHRDGTHHKKTS